MSRRQIKVIMGDLNKFTSNQIKRLTLDVHSALVQATPVKTGWARANWVPNIGVSFSGNFKEGDFSAPRAAQQAGTASILSYDIQRGPIYITNNAPYILKLNSGSSAQAPAGFVEAAIATSRKRFRR